MQLSQCAQNCCHVCPKNTQDGATKSSADQPLLSQNSYNQDGSPHLPYMQSSWQTHPQSQARCPIRVPYHPFQPHHLASMPGHHHPWPRQNTQGQASLQPDYPRSWTVGIPSGSEALWGQLYVEEPPAERGVPQVVGEEAETSRAPRSKGERGGGSRSSHLSQELDIKPGRKRKHDTYLFGLIFLVHVYSHVDTTFHLLYEL